MISLPIFQGALSSAADVPSLDLNFSGSSGFFAAKGATPTLTRGSVATYTDSAGVLRTTNSNILQYSNGFNTAPWTVNNTTITATATISPDQSLNAFELKDTVANTSHSFYQIPTGTAAGSYTFSIYAKKSGKRYMGVAYSGILAGVSVFDTELGVFTQTHASHTVSATPAGNGWFRFIITTQTASAGGGIGLTIFLSPTSTGVVGLPVYTGDGTGIYIYGAQMEEASYAGPYSPTTTVATNNGPRIDYDPVTLACKGLLIEEARTNLFLHSNNFTDAYWSKAQVTLANAVGVNSPDGSANATLITATNAAADGVYKLLSGPVGGTYSIYIKRNVGSYFSIWTSGDDNSACRFNILTNTIVYLGVNNESASVTPINNGWVRLSVIRKASAAISSSCFFAFIAPGGAPVATVGDNHYIYGAQLEVGTFPTSYIPTTTATVTRNADVCGLASLTGIWNATEGTSIVDFVTRPSIAGTYSLAAYKNAGGTNYLKQQRTLAAESSISAATGTIDVQTDFTSLGDGKGEMAIAYKSNDFAGVLNAGSAIADTSGATFTSASIDSLNIGRDQAGANWLNGHIARLRYFNKRLSNARLQNSTYADALDWRNVGPKYYQQYKSSIDATIATRTVTDATVEGGGTYASSLKFIGGLLLPDGRVFCNPFAVLYGSIYNPVTDSFTNTPNLIAGLYHNLGSVLLENGNIYLIPAQGGNLGVIYNPTTNTILTAPTGAATAPTNNEAYCGGVVMQDGRVFCVPSSATVARIYNPATNVLESPTITNGAFPGTATAYAGGVLLADGRVFLVPRNATVGKIYNPITNTITDTGNSVAATTEKYLGGVLMPNGKVFCVPLNSTVAKIYDPVTNLFEPDITGFGPGLLGGVLLPNGNIVCGAHTSGGSPKIYNPSTGAITTAAGTYGVSSGWGGTVLMNDGRVFCIPFAATKSKIYGGGGGFNPNIYLSPYYNKL